MSRTLVGLIVGLALGSLVSVALWNYWTPKCNEACPEWVQLSMLGFAALFPPLCAGAGAALNSGRYTPRARWALALTLLLFVALLIAVLGSSTP